MREPPAFDLFPRSVSSERHPALRKVLRSLWPALWGDPVWHPGALRLLLGAVVYGGFIAGTGWVFFFAPDLITTVAVWAYGIFLVVAVSCFFLFVLPKS